MQKINIWDNWARHMSVIFRDENPLIDGFVYLYAGWEEELSEDLTLKIYVQHGGTPEEGNYQIHNDYLINSLFFAAIKEKAGVKIFGLDDEAITLDVLELSEMETEIAQLGTIFALKTKQTGLEEFGQEFKNQTVYYSTLVGENSEGKKKFFACSAEGGRFLYYPVFLKEEHLKEFCEKNGRASYPGLYESLQNFLKLLDGNEKLQELGVAIEPFYGCSVSIPPLFRIEDP
jgi:hypothetical protein